MFDHMIEDHNTIRGIVTALRELLVEDGVPIGRWFASSRWALTRHLLRHFAMENLIFLGHPCASRFATAPAGPDPFEQRYRQHLNDWSPDRIDVEWPRYCSELGAILDTLERRMTFEEREIYPALVKRTGLSPAWQN